MTNPEKRMHQAASQSLSSIARQAFVPRRGRFLLPGWILVFGAGLSVVTWWRGMEQWKAGEHESFGVVAQYAANQIQVSVERRPTVLRQLAQLWTMHGLTQEDNWQFQSGMMLDRFPDLVSLSFVDSSGVIVRHVGRDTSITMRPEALAAARESFSQPLPDQAQVDQARNQAWSFLPLRTPDEKVGVLAAVWSLDTLFNTAGHELTPSVSFTVLDEDGRPVYTMREPSSRSSAWIVHTMELSSWLGRNWRLVVAPTDLWMGPRDHPWPWYVLIAGVLLSIAVSTMTFQFQRLQDYSRALSLANQELTTQVDALSASREKLRLANDTLEDRVQVRTRELEEIMREVEALGYSVSHDLRSPVGAIMNLTAIIEEDHSSVLPEDARRQLRRIRQSGESATRLLDRLGQYAWVGREQIRLQSIDMTESARLVLEEVRLAQENLNGVRFELGTLPRAWGDPELVERVFSNLISNAVKYSRQSESPLIEINGTSGPAEHTYLVSDNGIGFPPEVAQGLFEPFRRLHSSKDYEGAGLGLAIVAKSIRRLGGRVWAEGAEGEGARFYFTLPSSEGRA